jgi:hypothetical protein
MTLPTTGAISLGAVAAELGRAAGTLTSLGEASVRSLAGVASGAISLSNLYGKSTGTTITVTEGIYDTGGKVSFTYAGYSTSGSSCGYVLGSASPTIFKGVAIKGIWSVNAGSTNLDFAGDQTGNSSFLTGVTINGTGMGTVPAGSYNSSLNITTYTFQVTAFDGVGSSTVVLK